MARALIFTSAILMALGTSPSFAEADKPNVLFIAVEDLNAGGNEPKKCSTP